MHNKTKFFKKIAFFIYYLSRATILTTSIINPSCASENFQIESKNFIGLSSNKNNENYAQYFGTSVIGQWSPSKHNIIGASISLINSHTKINSYNANFYGPIGSLYGETNIGNFLLSINGAFGSIIGKYYNDSKNINFNYYCVGLGAGLGYVFSLDNHSLIPQLRLYGFGPILEPKKDTHPIERLMSEELLEEFNFYGKINFGFKLQYEYTIGNDMLGIIFYDRSTLYQDCDTRLTCLYTKDFESMKITPSVEIGAGYLSRYCIEHTTLSHNAGVLSFDLVPSVDIKIFAIGMSIKKDLIDLCIHYTLKIGEKYTSHSGMLKASWQF